MAIKPQSPWLSMLQSRKAMATLIGLILMVITAIATKTPIDPNTLLNGIMILVGIYVGSVAVEDGMSAKALANAATTTVSTPGGSDVTVTAPSEIVAVGDRDNLPFVKDPSQ